MSKILQQTVIFPKILKKLGSFFYSEGPFWCILNLRLFVVLSGQCSGHCMRQHVSRLSLLLVGWNTKKNNFLSKFVCL